MLPKLTINKIDGNIQRPIVSFDGIAGYLSKAPDSSTFDYTPFDELTLSDDTKLYVKAFSSEQEAFKALGYTSTQLQFNELPCQWEINVPDNASGTFRLSLDGFPELSMQSAVTFTGTGNNKRLQVARALQALGFEVVIDNSEEKLTITAPRTTFDSKQWYGSFIDSLFVTTGGSYAFLSGITIIGDRTRDNVIYHAYQIKEYFRLGGRKLYVGLRNINQDGDFTETYDEIYAMANYSNGEMKLLGIYEFAGETIDINSVGSYPLTISLLNTIQIKLNECSADNLDLQVVYGFDMKNSQDTAELSDLPDLKQATAPNVSVLIAEDRGSKGGNLARLSKYSIPFIGACLGVLSSNLVSESIAWVARLQTLGFNTTEYNSASFCDLNLTSVKDKTLHTELDNKRYTFLREIRNLNGTFITDSKTAINEALSDFAYVELNRAIEKAKRLINVVLQPELNSPLLVNKETGKLDVLYKERIERLIAVQLENMVNLTELSNYFIFIDTDQNVLLTSKLDIVVQLQPVGVARFIDVNLSFTV